MIKVTPKPGERIRNPFATPMTILPPGGETVADHRYWRRREREGSLIIDIVAIEPAQTAPGKKKDK